MLIWQGSYTKVWSLWRDLIVGCISDAAILLLSGYCFDGMQDVLSTLLLLLSVRQFQCCLVHSLNRVPIHVFKSLSRDSRNSEHTFKSNAQEHRTRTRAPLAHLMTSVIQQFVCQLYLHQRSFFRVNESERFGEQKSNAKQILIYTLILLK